MIVLKGENVAKAYKEEPSPHKLTREDWERIRREFAEQHKDDKPMDVVAEGSKAPYHREFVPYWHVGLGEWVKSPAHYKMMLKKHNAIEVGTEDIRSEKHRGLSAEEIRRRYQKGN